jgi:hypothetical protein
MCGTSFKSPLNRLFMGWKVLGITVYEMYVRVSSVGLDVQYAVTDSWWCHKEGKTCGVDEQAAAIWTLSLISPTSLEFWRDTPWKSLVVTYKAVRLDGQLY